MRTDTVVPASIRETRGKNEARRARKSGQVPAVVYGAFKDPVAILVSPVQIQKILRSSTGHNTIFDIAIEGGEQTAVMVVDEQYDPVKSNLLHVDLKRIDLAKRLRVTVPVITRGEAKGVKQQGGLLEIVTRSVEIECVPEHIPDKFVVEVTEMMIGEARRAGDLQLPEGVKLLSPADAVIVHVVGARAEEAAPEAAAAAEPEVVKKGKKEEAAPAADEKAKKK